MQPEGQSGNSRKVKGIVAQTLKTTRECMRELSMRAKIRIEMNRSKGVRPRTEGRPDVPPAVKPQSLCDGDVLSFVSSNRWEIVPENDLPHH
jgi:hypothetical protein